MTTPFSRVNSSTKGNRRGFPKSTTFPLLVCILISSLAFAFSGRAQTATIDDAWWTYQQDCDGDGCKAGTLPDNFARLNWNPDVVNCNGTLTVFEVLYYRSCTAANWTPIHTNAPHSITGCRSSDGEYVDLQIAGGCACRDYMIAIFRNGQSNPDYRRSNTNDVDLRHQEELLSEDLCLNDTFATCAPISGTFGSRYDNNANATKEAGEPIHAGDAGGKSLWYCWTATTNRPVTFDTPGSSFDTLLAVYTGDYVTNLSLVVSNDDIAGAANRQSRVTFTPTTGTTYHVAVDGYGGASGIGALIWNQSGAALPDLILWGPAVSARVVTSNFLATSCDVLEGCATAGIRRLLSFTTESRNIGAGDLIMGNPATNPLFDFASCHGHYHFEEYANYSLLDTNGNTVVLGHKIGFCLLDSRAFSPTANPAARYNCNNQGIQAGWADVYSAGLPCQYIDVTGVPAGEYVLKMVVNPAGLIPESNTNNNVTLVPVTIPPTNCAAPPTQDYFTNAMVVPGAPFSTAELNACASKETGEPNHAGKVGGHSLWYSWTPTSNHTAIINTKRSTFDTLLAVYTGTSISGLSLVVSNDDIATTNKQSQVSFTATAGTTYQIAVDGFNGAVGTVVLNLNPPGNDDFGAAHAIAGTSGQTNGYTIAASKQSGEPAHAYDVGGKSVWYRWTAPTNGPVEFDTAGSTYDTTLAVYTNNVLTNLTLIAANNDDAGGFLTSRLWFNAIAGKIYQVAVDGAAGDDGFISLNWNMNCRLAVAQLPGGQIQLTVTGVSGQRYQIQTSGNLSNWTALATITVSADSQTYTDSLGAGPKFYRAVLVP